MAPATDPRDGLALDERTAVRIRSSEKLLLPSSRAGQLVDAVADPLEARPLARRPGSQRRFHGGPEQRLAGKLLCRSMDLARTHRLSNRCHGSSGFATHSLPSPPELDGPGPSRYANNVLHHDTGRWVTL